MAKGYVRSDFAELFKRYMPLSEVEALREEIMPETERAAYERRKQEAEQAQAMRMQNASTLELLGKLSKLAKR